MARGTTRFGAILTVGFTARRTGRVFRMLRRREFRRDVFDAAIVIARLNPPRRVRTSNCLLRLDSNCRVLLLSMLLRYLRRSTIM